MIKFFYKLLMTVSIIINMAIKPLIFICLLEGAYLLYAIINLHHMMVIA